MATAAAPRVLAAFPYLGLATGGTIVTVRGWGFSDTGRVICRLDDVSLGLRHEEMRKTSSNIIIKIFNKIRKPSGSLLTIVTTALIAVTQLAFRLRWKECGCRRMKSRVPPHPMSQR